MLKMAFNAILKLHSRQATLKRLGNPDIFSPAKIAPSNYFRFLRGPEYTTIPGREFVIPNDSLLGEFAQDITFTGVPTSGTFKLAYGVLETTDLPFDETAANIQIALRLLAGLENVVVTGNFTTGFKVLFTGFQTEPTPLTVEDYTLDFPETISKSYVKWAVQMQKGDRIIDGSKQYAVDEIMEMPDLGGTIMGWRCRCD